MIMTTCNGRAIGRVGSLPRAEGLRGPPSTKKGPQAYRLHVHL